jgi:hypothetical protein
MVDGGRVTDGYLGKAGVQSRGFCFANVLLGLELVLGAVSYRPSSISCFSIVTRQSS